MYEELKKAAERATKSKWTTDGDWDVMSAESDQLNDGYVIAQFQGPDRKANADFCAAANPSAVLALIAENGMLRDGLADIAKKASESRSLTRRLTWIEGRAESALLGKPWASHVFMMPDPKNGKPKAERLEAENKLLKAENEALRKDAERYRWLRGNHIFAHVQVEQSDGTQPYVYDSELDRSVDEIISALNEGSGQ